MVVDIYQKKVIKKYKNSVPSRKYILLLLKKYNNLISKKILEKKLHINCRKEKQILRQRLKRMEKDNQIIYTSNRRYISLENLNLVKGKVIGHRDGYGFLRTETLKEDVWISKDEMKSCIHGDLVLAHIIQLNKKRNIAKILKVFQSTNILIVGRYYLDKKIEFVIPNDSRFNFKIFILPSIINNKITIGSIVLVKLKKGFFKNKIQGKIIEVLGKKMGIDLSINVALRTHNIPYSWSREVKNQLCRISNKISQKDLDNRVDLRHFPFFTIDEKDARDFDDAIFCKKKKDLEEGWNLWVAIADVSYYIKPNTALDKAAFNRGNSVYFPSLVVPMLPEKISTDLCSLNPSVDRLCLICEMSLSSEGKLVQYKHYEAVIRSHGRFTYDEIFDIWNGNVELQLKYKKLLKYIQNMFFLYKFLNKKRFLKKGISFENAEAKFILDDHFRINKIYQKIRNDAHKFIETCMILANIASARFIEKYNYPILFRNHAQPSKESVSSFRLLLKELGLSLLGGDNPKACHYSILLKKILNRPDYEMIQTLLLRSMKQAVYSPINCGHFGLALSSYVHFTSPIRRYPDLILHRIIKKLILKNKREASFKKESCNYKKFFLYNINEMKKIGAHCSITERRADDATRDVVDWLKCEFMKNKIGYILTGVISNVTSFGFFVRLDKFFIDGLVHIEKLSDDYYYFDSMGLKLIGKSTKNIYRLGDTLKVKVISVNLNQRKIELSL
ncbi:ribonuclease R [Buchnera aphidicola (Melanaphis sacchari)]|uniref:Ribonuclease R n=1 Tax=Buchnera aphidicola (Melanaphis sacchari) TaxID=2173854 RepID=A0A2U8DFF4_9GAMM|nr:ribonuclease R [Buchnera aphidicola]AWH90261.1 ribonuclease R [Buchnera aphidicola (Melanaphis sacchari)]